MKSKRNYRKEYDSYHKLPASKKDRASRNRARSTAKRLGLVSKGDGKDIDHRDGNPRNNARRNLRVLSKSSNRRKNGR